MRRLPGSSAGKGQNGQKEEAEQRCGEKKAWLCLGQTPPGPPAETQKPDPPPPLIPLGLGSGTKPSAQHVPAPPTPEPDPHASSGLEMGSFQGWGGGSGKGRASGVRRPGVFPACGLQLRCWFCSGSPHPGEEDGNTNVA